MRAMCRGQTVLERWQSAEAFGEDFNGSPCMVLPNQPGRGGYVRIKNQQAHRVIYEELRGPIPAGLMLDHLCASTNGLRSCVNPWHMEPVSLKENIRRGTSPSAKNAAKTHCKRGHEFTPESTYVVLGKWRRCKLCRKSDAWSVRRRETRAQRRQARAGICINGHAWTVDNIYLYRGIRSCRKCQAEANRRYRVKLAGKGS